MPPFFERLKERKLVRWGLTYLAGSAVVVELMSYAGDSWSLPNRFDQILLTVLAVGFAITLVVAWFHGEPGRQRVRRTEILVLAGVLAVGAGSVALIGVADPGGDDGAGSSLSPTGPLRLGVLPVRTLVDPPGAPERLDLLRHLFSSELARRRGLVVFDDLSLETLMRRAGDGSAVEELSAPDGADLDYVVRTTVTGTSEESEVNYALVEASTGEVLTNGSFSLADRAGLPGQVRQAADRLFRHLDERIGGINKALDADPWLTRPPADVEAHEAFLQGLEYSYRAVPGGREHFERALEIEPSFIGPRVWLVSGLTSAGDTAAAREHVRVLRTLEDQATPFERAMIGWAEAVVSGDLESRVRHLEVALSYSPHNNVLLYNVAGALASLERYEEAAEALRPVVDAHWHYSQAYTGWGVVSIETGRLEGLRQQLEEALTITPQSTYLHGLLEALTLFEGDTEAAERYGLLFRQRFPEGGAEQAYLTLLPSYRRLAELASERGRPGATLRLLQRALDAAPSHHAVRLELARALARGGRAEAAEEHYLRVLAAEVEEPEVVYLLGEAARLLGRTEEAGEHFTRYLELAPDGPRAIDARERRRSLAGSS